MMLSPAVDCERERLKRSSPSKQSCAHSPSDLHLRSCSRSNSPSCQCRCHHPSAERTYRSPNPRCNNQNPSSRGKGKGGEQSFFQGGTAAWGRSTCVICLGHHKHKYTKCSATKLWNRGKTWVHRNNSRWLISVEGLPICLSFQTSAGCSGTTHPTRHTCSGCGKSGHGAQQCPLVQKI